MAPGLPRPRLARVLMRRSARDAEQIRRALDLGAVLALAGCVIGIWPVPLAIVAITAVVCVRFAWRIARRNKVLAALGEDGGVVVVTEGDKHVLTVTESTGHREADR